MSDGLAGLATKAAGLPARYFFAAAAMAGGLLAAMESKWSAVFGLTSVPPYTRATLTVICLLGVVVGSTKAISGVFGGMSAARDYERRVRENLTSLSTDEITVLAYFVLHNQPTFYAPFTHGVLHGLVAKGLLTHATGAGNILAWPFAIHPIAFEYFRSAIDSGEINQSGIAQIRGMTSSQLLEHVDPVRRQLRGL